MYCYIHIPFCDNKCIYCKFASRWFSQESKKEKYLTYLCWEINNVYFLEKIYWKNKKDFKKLKSIYFWWWTPTSLQNEQLKKIIQNLEKKFGFEKNIEITLETTSNKINKNNLDFWRKIWINRLSIWVQTLNKKSLIEIWRENKWNIIDALGEIKPPFNSSIPRGGVKELLISLDFIVWLPYVEKWEIKKDIEFILDKFNFINHISVYMLEEYYYPNNWKNFSIKKEEYLWEYIEIKNFLKKKWFYNYEISNFAKSWFECRHNKAYWTHKEILAFWLASHWYLNWIRYFHSEKFNWYYNWKISFDEKNNEESIFLEKIMFWLRTFWIEKKYYLKLNQEKISEFIKSWYLKIENGILKLDDKWVLFLDYILGEIM